MILIGILGYFYIIPMLFIWLILRRAVKNNVMKFEDAEGLFPFSLLPVINFMVFVWILKEGLKDLHLYNRFIKFILGEK
jgi:hypothetical protein